MLKAFSSPSRIFCTKKQFSLLLMLFITATYVVIKTFDLLLHYFTFRMLFMIACHFTVI